MNRIALIALTYLRPELTKIFLQYYNEQKQKLAQNGYELILICVGSEGDKSRISAQDNGWEYFEHPNKPLSLKVERGFLEARKKQAVKGCVWIGSDDFLQYELLEYYFKTFSGNENNVYGLDSMYFYSIKRNQALRYYVHDRCEENTVGTAKFYSRAVLDKVDWRICYSKVSNRGIDSFAFRQMKKDHRITDVAFTMEQSGICVDIKAEVSMTDWRMIQDNPCEQTEIEFLIKAFPETMKKIIAIAPIIDREDLYSIQDM